jgi:hypothetical protein
MGVHTAIISGPVMQQKHGARNTYQGLHAVQPIWKAFEPQVCCGGLGAGIPDPGPNTQEQRFSGLVNLNNPCTWYMPQM